MNDTHVWIADPASSKHKLTKAEFMKSFASDKDEGIILLFEPTVNFASLHIQEEKPKGLKFILSYLTPHTRLILNLILGLIIATVVQLILPFLTQSLVDIGIDTKNLDFITLILIASLAVNIFGQLARFLQSWIILEIGTRVNVSLVSDFLFKDVVVQYGFDFVLLINKLSIF
jgi:ATP-binding cassette subfamily B protein